VDVGEAECEPVDARLQRRLPGLAVEPGRRVATAGEGFLRAAARELIAREHAVAVETAEIKISRAAVEAREEKRVASRLAGDEAIVAACAQHRAGHFISLLGELGDRGALFALRVPEGERPAPGEIE